MDSVCQKTCQFDQGQQNWYENGKLSVGYCHATFERSHFKNSLIKIALKQNKQKKQSSRKSPCYKFSPNPLTYKLPALKDKPRSLKRLFGDHVYVTTANSLTLSDKHLLRKINVKFCFSDACAILKLSQSYRK